MIKEVLNLLEKLDNLIEYIEKSDAFETLAENKVNKKQEKLLEKELLQGYKKPTVKEAILSNLYEYFKKFKFLQDLNLYENRVQFWMPYYKNDWLWEWESTSKALSNANLNVYTYNSSEGYIVEIS